MRIPFDAGYPVRMKGRDWIFLAALTASIVPGCSKANPSLVGTWLTSSESRGLPTETEATFEANGGYRAVTRYMNKGKLEMTATDVGTYTFSEGRLTVKLKDVDWTWPNPADKHAKEAAEVFRQNKATIIASVNEGGPISVRWTTPDEIRCSVPQADGEYVYRRKKTG